MDSWQNNNQSLYDTSGSGTVVMGLDESRELSAEYRIIGRGGTGGCAVVDEGYRLSDNKHVAVKILSLPAGLEYEEAERTRLRFYREAKLMASMKSPYIVECLDYGLFDGKPCMILEFMDGVQLDDYLKRKGAMSFEKAVDITCQVLEGLGVAHKMGVIHRDIKPANVMVLNNTQNTEIRVYDFGIATVLDDAPGDLMRTQVGSIRGTPSYMAPELFSGEVRACPATDIYAVGLMLHECLTGTVAVMGTSLIQISFKQMHEPLDIPLFIPECLANVIHKCCAKKVDDRYQSAEEVIEALRGVLPEAEKERIACEAKYLEAIREKGEKGEKSGAKIQLSKPMLAAIVAGVLVCVGLIIALVVVGVSKHTTQASDNDPLGETTHTIPDAEQTTPDVAAEEQKVPDNPEVPKAEEGQEDLSQKPDKDEIPPDDALNAQNQAEPQESTENAAEKKRSRKGKTTSKTSGSKKTSRVRKDTTAIPNFY